jgi:alkylation response protein AidB-like acyl-CoA dehydrogenase
MELDLSDDQEELRDAIRTVLTKESPITLARGVVEDDIRPDALWDTFVELGWPALTIAPEHGGVGLGPVEAAMLAEELGRVVAPGPLLATVTQFVPAVRECGTDEQQARWLGAVAGGDIAGSLALCERSGSFDPADVSTTFAVAGDDVVLQGEKRYVIEGDAVDELVVAAREEGTAGAQGVRAIVVPTSALGCTRVRALDSSRRLAHVRLDGVRIGRERVLSKGTAGAVPLQRATEEATVALALEMVGTAQTIFDVTIEYAKQRVQFGVPIGSFQAIKHKFADMLVALERARATGYFAALTLAEDDRRRSTATSVAKVAAGDCQRLLAKEGIQLHGGIGYTWEHDMHLYVKRLKSGEQLFGTSATHRTRLADALGV